MAAPSVIEYEALPDYEEIQEFLDEDPPHFAIGSEDSFRPDPRCAICVDGLPIVTKEKEAKLIERVLVHFNVSANISVEDVIMPFDDDAQQSMGFVFIKYNSPEDAGMAIKSQNGQAFNNVQKYRMSVYSYADLERYGSMPTEYTPPTPQPFVPHCDPKWLMDEHYRDQFVVRYKLTTNQETRQETEVWWCNMDSEPSLQYAGEDQKKNSRNWAERHVAWSPQGTYLVTFVLDKGVVLWGGERFAKQGRFEHPSCESISFDPTEKFLCTYGFDMRVQSQAIIVWSVMDNRKLRALPLRNPYETGFIVKVTDKVSANTVKTLWGPITVEESKHEFHIDCGPNDQYRGTIVDREFQVVDGNELKTLDVQAVSNPNILKWSYDGTMVARVNGNVINVYELPSMNLLDKKSIAAVGIVDFEWSPTSNIIAYWAVGLGNSPSKVTVLELPSRNELTRRNLFSVTDGRMSWQENGDYLGVQMLKQTTKKVPAKSLLMVFRIREPLVPVEQIEMEDPIVNVSWEPRGHRFAVVCSDRRQKTLHFYSMEHGVLTKLSTLGAASEKLSDKHISKFDAVYWSPAGTVCVLAFHQQESQVFDFYDVSQSAYLTDSARKHDLGNQLLWDPSGRVLASVAKTANFNMKAELDYGYALYTFQGDVICRVRKQLSQFLWRPRPVLLSPEKQAEISKDLNKYKKKFEREDRERQRTKKKAFNKQRTKMAKEFMVLLNRGREEFSAAKRERVDLRNGYDSDDERMFVSQKEIVEQVISVKEEIIRD